MKLIALLLIFLVTSAQSAVSKKEYNLVLEKLEKFYAHKVQFINKWESNDRWAEAKLIDGEAVIFIHGGLARSMSMTFDGLLLTGCHELGHHIGGFPLFDDGWSSFEGQADYFATLKCMKQVLKGDPKNLKVNSWGIPNAVKRKCSEQYPSKDAYGICIRSLKAAEATLVTLLEVNKPAPTPEPYVFPREEVKPHGSYGQEFGGEQHAPIVEVSPIVEVDFSFSSQDSSVVGTTESRVNESQCRLDTFYQGALCNVDPNIALDNTDETVGTCHPKNGHRIGARPACWFKSQN